MFKVGKLEDINDIEVNINTVIHTTYNVEDDKHIQYNTLAFDITGNLNGNTYNFSFGLNCKPEELLELEIGKTKDFKKYIFDNDAMFSYNGITDINPKYDITINRYMNNKYVVLTNIFTSLEEEIYSSIIEFDFNLDEYIGE